MTAASVCILLSVIIMKNQELLSTLLITAQAGQIEIRRILNTVMESGMRVTLRSQLREYDAMETEALIIALQRGWELRSLSPAAGFLKDKITRLRTHACGSDSKIAEIMIRSNTNAMIRNHRQINRSSGQDSPVLILAQKMLDCETAHIRRLQQYL